jgi:hypothetical protein
MNEDLLSHVASNNNIRKQATSNALPCIPNVSIISMSAVVCVAIGDTTLSIA